jgi:hypothetical protein
MGDEPPAALAGASIAIERFAFGPSQAVWIAFGAAIAAGVFSLAAAAVAILRENHGFSGVSALTALVAGFTVIGTRSSTRQPRCGLAFAGGVAMLLLSLRALALHETTVERVVHQLQLNGPGQPTASVRQGRIEVSGMNSKWQAQRRVESWPRPRSAKESTNSDRPECGRRGAASGPPLYCVRELGDSRPSDRARSTASARRCTPSLA